MKMQNILLLSVLVLPGWNSIARVEELQNLEAGEPRGYKYSYSSEFIKRILERRQQLDNHKEDRQKTRSTNGCRNLINVNIPYTT